MPKMVCPEIYLRYPYDVSAILLWIVPRYKDKAMIRPAMPRWTMPLRFTWDNPMICRWGDTAMICPEMKTTICLRYYQYLPWNPCMACDAKMVFNWDLPVYMRIPICRWYNYDMSQDKDNDMPEILWRSALNSPYSLRCRDGSFYAKYEMHDVWMGSQLMNGRMWN